MSLPSSRRLLSVLIFCLEHHSRRPVAADEVSTPFTQVASHLPSAQRACTPVGRAARGCRGERRYLHLRPPPSPAQRRPRRSRAATACPSSGSRARAIRCGPRPRTSSTVPRRTQSTCRVSTTACRAARRMRARIARTASTSARTSAASRTSSAPPPGYGSESAIVADLRSGLHKRVPRPPIFFIPLQSHMFVTFKSCICMLELITVAIFARCTKQMKHD